MTSRPDRLRLSCSGCPRPDWAPRCAESQARQVGHAQRVRADLSVGLTARGGPVGLGGSAGAWPPAAAGLAKHKDTGWRRTPQTREHRSQWPMAGRTKLAEC